ncbi:hypothetical protein BJ944DRAFT_1784 [Cunninghamella echinulata]|nr:hypothetical protein BJ944DRAFT_1784 [Cunninghamella echinulata]
MVKKEINDYDPPIKDIEKQATGIFKSFLFENNPLYDSIIYSNIRASIKEWTLLSKEEATPYLPLNQEPVSVDLGIKDTKNYSLPTLSVINLDSAIPYKRGHLINFGGVISGLEYIPKTTHSKDSNRQQYLSIGGLKAPCTDFAYEGEKKSYPNAIQIWRCDLSAAADDNNNSSKNGNSIENQSTASSTPSISLDLCILHDFGDVRELKWCPYGAYDDENEENEKKGKGKDDVNQSIAKLGILAACFGDGSLRIIVVPHPNVLRRKQNIGLDKTIFLKIKKPRYTISFTNSIITTISWGGHKKLAVGTSSGYISVWNMEAAFQANTTDNDVLPKKYMLFNNLVHDAGVQEIEWHGINDPVNFASIGNDGRFLFINIEDPFVPILFWRHRSIQYSLTWPGYRNRIYFSDSDLKVRERSVDDCTEFKQGQFYTEGRGYCFSIASSEVHSFIIHGSSDGFVSFNNVYVQRIRGTVIKSTICSIPINLQR